MHTLTGKTQVVMFAWGVLNTFQRILPLAPAEVALIRNGAVTAEQLRMYRGGS